MILGARYHRPFTFFLILYSFQFILSVNGVCFFPTELQGEFIMQSISMADSQVQYSHVNITADAIPVWGLCHRRIGNNVILMDSFSGANCIRCFQLTLRSKNVLQVKTEGLDKCYTTEDAAEATCPRETNANSNNLKEILLYKTKDLGGEEIRKEYCPIHGKFTFAYNINDGSEDKMECDNYISQLDTCSSALPASSLHLNFRSCSFIDHDITFVCLGEWHGPGNQRYLALQDTNTTHNRPQYRCAMYHTDPATNIAYIAFSSDSTCSTNLVNSTSGFETLILKPIPEPAWPQKVAASSGRLPAWTQGNWEHMSVEGHTITYKDHSRFQTLKIRVMGFDSASSERFPVYIHDECGGESYNCIWLKRRGMNVLEFQLGIYPSVVYNDSLCIDDNFQSKVWITQGRLERLQESPCPITGEYTGFIPDEGDRLCAKLSSDCKSPEIMYYTLSACAQKDIYEEREYRCLGQWEENGLTYTYTQRKDIGIYECFVGSIISNNEIYIKEAGEHCERDVDPLHLGMKLSRKGACTEIDPSPVPWDSSSPYPYTQRPTVTWPHPPRQPHVTKPWKPITAPPRIKNEVLSSGSKKMPFWLTIWSPYLFSVVVRYFLVYNSNCYY